MIIVLSLVDVVVVNVPVSVSGHHSDVIMMMFMLMLFWWLSLLWLVSCYCLSWWVWSCRGGQEWHQEASQPMESVRFRHRPVRAL